MKIRPANVAHGGKHISPPREPSDAEPVQLSFKLLDIHTNDKFTLKHCEQAYLEKFLLRLQELNRLTIREFRLFRREWRNHVIEFSETSEPDGFKQLPEQLRSKEAWQFQLTKGEHGRVHGLLMDNVFFVVWLDPCHQLYTDALSDCRH